MSETTRLPGPVADLWDWQLEGSCRRVGPDVFFAHLVHLEPDEIRLLAELHQIHHVVTQDPQGLGDPALQQHPKTAGTQVLIQAAEGLVGPFMMGLADEGNGFERRIHRLSGLGKSCGEYTALCRGFVCLHAPWRNQPRKAASWPAGGRHCARYALFPLKAGAASP